MTQSQSILPPLIAVEWVQTTICRLQDTDRDREERECPVCQTEMQRWAGFYRCQHCGFKESCCF
jgi:predicted amidophosphoribosyltransferase